MKIRNGFVSNSSSSSFIIAIKPTEKCPHCGRSDVDVLDVIRKVDDYDSEIHAEGLSAVLEELDDWIINDNPKVIEEAKKLDKEDHKIAYISISYHNPMLNDLLKNEPSITILSSDNN